MCVCKKKTSGKKSGKKKSSMKTKYIYVRLNMYIKIYLMVVDKTRIIFGNTHLHCINPIEAEKIKKKQNIMKIFYIISQ